MFDDPYEYIGDEVVICNNPRIAGHITGYDLERNVCQIMLTEPFGEKTPLEMILFRGEVEKLLGIYPESKEQEPPEWSQRVYWFQGFITDVTANIDFLSREPLADDPIRKELLKARRHMEKAQSLADKYDPYIEPEKAE